MGDSGRERPDRRRVGDETRARIEDLADGWSVKQQPPTAADAPDTEPVERVPPMPPPIPTPDPAPRAAAPPPTPPPVPPAASVEIEARRPRADDTAGEDRTVLQVDPPRLGTANTSGLRPREPETVPRSRGVLGDIRYVFDAMFGVTAARRELAEVQQELEGERHGRDERLRAVARYTIADDAVTLPAVEDARDQLADIEERRSRHAGASAAAQQEIQSIEQERELQAAAWHEEDKRLATELVAIEAKLAPVEKQAASVKRRLADMKATAAGLDKKIGAEERKLVAAKAPRQGPAAVEAHLASLRAERESVMAEEPGLTAELDELEPQISSLQASHADAERDRTNARERETRDAARAIERIDAAKQRRDIEDKTVGDLADEREAALLALGEVLDVERPTGIASRLAGADEHAVAIATHERRVLELQELVAGIDRVALARGIGWLVLALAGVVGIVWLMVSLV